MIKPRVMHPYPYPTQTNLELQLPVLSAPDNLTAFNVSQTFALASLLEMLVETPNRAYAGHNLPLDRRWVYYPLAGINSALAYYFLTAEIFHEGRQPENIYKYVELAQRLSPNHRKGGRVNIGINQVSVPLVTSWVLNENKEDWESTIDKMKEILIRTTPADVASFYSACMIAKRQGKSDKREWRQPDGFQNVYDYIQHAVDPIKRPIARIWFDDWTLGFPTIRRIYQALVTRREPFNITLSNEYNKIIAENPIIPEYWDDKYTKPNFPVSDYMVATLILYLLNNPNEQIV